ncbi:armadillo-type protein [Radiomyces spectabilis]|uniref:armadillo-type protein n=1 Tax=Radiomyces spectabilis TaxID=64574 RepID=UPI002220CF61|nr:armadillo-type protein [Radiomyces spectabilis]KAI8368259.1 armadillo-type protein [Radiomyces spectabilis]
MNTTQTSATNAKPALHGVRIKQRKGAQKAQAKHEPEIFRDNLLKQLNNAKTGNLEDVSQILDTSSNTLDYRKYGEALFEILITGGILEPGAIINADAERSPFSLFGAENDAAVIKRHTDVFSKLIRRYKYLQRPFEETLKNILQYINKWQPVENNNLAIAVGCFIINGLITPSILKVIFKDYLVKDGHSLEFSTTVFRTVLNEQSIEQFGKSLIASGLDSKLIELFPPNKREDECLIRHFEAEDMKQLVDFHMKNQKNSMKGDLLIDLKEMMHDEANVSEVVAYVKQNTKEAGLSEQEVIQIAWSAVLLTVDLINARPDQVESQALRAVTRWSPMLETFATSPKTEIVLLQKVQVTCYEDAKLTKFFRQIIQLLYKMDVVSDNAILYWAEKAHKPQGKTVFLKQMAPFVQWLKDNEDSSEEED